MPSPSTHLALHVFSGGENFSTALYDENWQTLDNSPGIFICAASSRPTSWGSAQAGMQIYETDRSLFWRWTGVTWVRSFPTGLIARTTRLSPVSTSSTWTPGSSSGLVTVVSEIISIPAGGRPLLVVAELAQLINTNGIGIVAIQRDSTFLNWWNVSAPSDSTANGQGKPGPFVLIDQPSTSSVTYSIMIASTVTFGGTTTVTGSAAQPISISVIEV